jgi:hypothetical protein
MAKKNRYGNPYMELVVPDTIGFVLSGVSPNLGHFGSTSKLEKGVQLKEHHGRIRTQYNTVLQKLDKSGFHSAHGELLRATYDRTTEGNKVKDMGLLFYCLTVKGKDLDFLSTVLHDNENGEEKEVEDKDDCETTYGKRQRSMKHKADARLAASDDRQINMLRSVMSPNGSASSSDDEVIKSTIAKNEMSIVTAGKQALYITSLTVAEQVKSDILEMNNIKSQLSDVNASSYFSQDDINELRQRLRTLMKLPRQENSNV